MSSSSWWNTIALPIISFMRRQNYPEDSLDAYTKFWRDKLLPLLGPCKTPAYPSWITDDHTPVEFSIILGNGNKSSVRFAFEPSALPLAGDRSIETLRRTLERLSRALPMEPKFDLEWFEICAEELLLNEAQDRPVTELPVSETCLVGFDCAEYSASAKAYFMPRIRSLVSKEKPEDMVKRATDRMGLGEPWTKISQFLSRFTLGGRPEIDIVAIDCVPGARNRLKVYFRADLESYAQMEYLLRLGGLLSAADVSVGLYNARLIWDAMTQVHGVPVITNGSPSQSSTFPGALIYYELKQGADVPSSKVYLPVQRYLPNDLAISHAVEHLASQLAKSSAMAKGYSDFIQKTFSHRALSARTGIHTYVACTLKPGGSDISIYYSPETYALERKTCS
ncbi:aromatic prenyltransferase [Mycena capillaripes]|nr:aromatic prenyltransferase [Mycena capillaripes]